jgi:ApbE superfamily uncharacterized protein (UPF0280 family)
MEADHEDNTIHQKVQTKTTTVVIEATTKTTIEQLKAISIHNMKLCRAIYSARQRVRENPNLRLSLLEELVKPEDMSEIQPFMQPCRLEDAGRFYINWSAH